MGESNGDLRFLGLALTKDDTGRKMGTIMEKDPNIWEDFRSEWRFVAGEKIELDGRCPSQPCLMTGGYHI